MKITDISCAECLSFIENINDDKEYCFIIREDKIIEAVNFSRNPNSVFIDRANVLPGDIVLHTHYLDEQAASFSLRDIITSKKSGCKIMLYHTKSRQFDYYDPNYPHPYPLKVNEDSLTIKSFIGLKYEPVRCDCYSYTRDVAKAIYNIDLPDIFKEKISYLNLRMLFLQPEILGFNKIYNYKEGDFVLMNLSASTPFHMGILIDDDEMLHSLSDEHPTGLLSLASVKKNILGIYRYNKLDTINIFDKYATRHFTNLAH